ncbi:hypothetical protein IP81_15090 [Novosphingobium sp. AAP83]|nr:hypothetical protein IP81_15090 [Novosphingobium sp. AAP83]
MLLTPFAESLIEPLRDTMGHIDTLVNATSTFDAAKSHRSFTIVTSDDLFPVLMPHAMARIVQAAPNVSLEFFLPAGSPGSSLRRGEVDLILTPDGFIPPPYICQPFCEEDFVVLGWKGNPMLSDMLDLERFFSLRQVVVRFPNAAERSLTGQVVSFAEMALVSAGFSPSVAVIVPTFSAVFPTVIGSPFIAVVHRRLARALSSPEHHVVCELPLKIGPMREVALYHPLRANDAGLHWLLKTLREALDDVDGAAEAVLVGSAGKEARC